MLTQCVLEAEIGDGMSGDGAKTQKRLAIVQFCEGSVRGRPWAGRKHFGAVTFPSMKLPVTQSAIF